MTNKNKKLSTNTINKGEKDGSLEAQGLAFPRQRVTESHWKR